jgi:hypothetical protein
MDTRAPPQTVSILSFPRNRIQDVKSRLATERVLSKSKNFDQHFYFLKKRLRAMKFRL